MTAEIAASLGLPRPVGVLLKDVAPNSPAAKGGLRVGDVVESINGHEVEDLESLRFRVATLPVGSTARLDGLPRRRHSATSMSCSPRRPRTRRAT